MSYRLEPKEPLPGGIKRIATEQVNQALKQLTEAPQGQDEAVHDARKRFKKVRAVLRLVRGEIGEGFYKYENRCYRDAGRKLSAVRDSYVKVETVDKLTQRYADRISSDRFAALRAKLAKEHEVRKERLLNRMNAVDEVVATIHNARERIIEWPVAQSNFSAIRPGLKRVYRRGDKRFARAYNNPTVENFHEWRKRVKYLWYHVRILRPLWPGYFRELANQTHTLSNYLGDDHDLAELRQLVLSRPELFDGQNETMEELVELINQDHADLRASARYLGGRIYAEKAGTFVDRVGHYWDIMALG